MNCLDIQKTKFLFLHNFSRLSRMPCQKEKNGKRGRWFHANWCDSFSQLHYHPEKDAGICYIGMSCNKQQKWSKFSGKRDPAFFERGFRNWEKCPEALTIHETSDNHCNYVKLLNDEEITNDIADAFSDILIRKKANSRQIFLQVLQNIHFLTHQGLDFRSDYGDENFDQLLKQCGKLDPRITEWSNKNRKKFLHNEYQKTQWRISIRVLSM